MTDIKRKQKNTIDALIDRHLENMNSERNSAVRRLWHAADGWNRDMLRCNPISSDGKVPFTIALDNSMIGALLNFDLRDYYQDAYTHLEKQLLYRDYNFVHFRDDTPITDELFIWWGVVSELSLFGPKIKWFSNREGWIENYIVQDEEDLECMELPDFFKSGIMPMAHEFYEYFQEMAGGRMRVMFPMWNRGPFCMAAHLNGLENILCNMLVEPEFVHKLMRYATDSIKHFMTERAKFLGEAALPKGKLYDDEVDIPTISKELYDEFVLPYEIELAEFYGGIRYWHSCGNTTDIIESVGRIKNLDVFHCGPWSDEKKAADVLGTKTAIEKCVDPERDVYFMGEAQIEQSLKTIVANCEGARLTIRADAFQPRGNLYDRMREIDAWNRVASRVLGSVY